MNTEFPTLENIRDLMSKTAHLQYQQSRVLEGLFNSFKEIELPGDGWLILAGHEHEESTIALLKRLVNESEELARRARDLRNLLIRRQGRALCEKAIRDSANDH